jgi:hypothetical protein
MKYGVVDPMKKLCALLWLVALASVCSAQGGDKKSEGKTPPDLSGTWSLDKKKSDIGFGMKAEFADVTLSISQNESEVRMTKKINEGGRETTSESVYRLGGKEAAGGGGKAQAVSKWSGRKLVTKLPIQISASVPGARASDTGAVEEWEISKDGRTLTQTVTAQGVPNLLPASKSKIVFNRVP